MSRTDAVEALYQDMAARHRSRFRSIHVYFLLSYGLRWNGLTYIFRSSKSLSLKEPMMSRGLTLNSSFKRTWSSLCHTVCLAQPARNSFTHTVLRHLPRHQESAIWYVDGWVWKQVAKTPRVTFDQIIRMQRSSIFRFAYKQPWHNPIVGLMTLMLKKKNR